MRLVFIGPPGAGKGTQAKLLRDHFKIAHISTGDMIRERIAAATPTGRKAKLSYDRGELVPDQIMVEMVAERLEEADCHGGFLLDGFPRTLAQAAALDRSLDALGKGLDAAILIEVEEDELVRRLSGRWTCSNTDCAAPYNAFSNPPQVSGQCDLCGSPLAQRDDDRPETIRTRFRQYREQTAPVVGYYRERGLLHTVSGMGSVEETKEGIRQTLQDAW